MEQLRGFLVFLVLMMLGLAGYEGCRSFWSTRERRQVRDLYGEDLAAICDGGRGAIDAVTAPETHRVLILETGTKKRHQWHGALPTALAATNAKDVGIVVCVDESSLTEPSCAYEGGKSVTRERARLRLAFIDPKTKKVFAQPVIEAGPPECPGAVTASTSIRSSVEYRQFEAAVLLTHREILSRRPIAGR